MASIEIRDLCKYFGNVKAVDHLSLEIENGEFVALLGPSGCGKTTTLLCIAGLEEPTSGLILFDGQPVNELSPRDRNVAMVFQDYALYPHMSVFDNMAFGLRQRKSPRAMTEESVRSAAAVLGIEALLDRKPAQLSGGQRQRVALGRAIVRNPVAFLMDEPLSNLDAALRIRTRSELKELQKRLGITAVYVTHDQEEAMVISDRLAILKDGVLQQYGTPYEVYDHPANLYVAGFIGSPSMSFIEGELQQVKEGQFAFQRKALRIDPVSVDLSRQLGKVTAPVLLGVRPEGIRISSSEEGADFVSKVLLLEPTGPTTYVDVVFDDVVMKAGIGPKSGLEVGAKVGVKLVRDSIYLFDKGTGINLA